MFTRITLIFITLFAINSAYAQVKDNDMRAANKQYQPKTSSGNRAMMGGKYQKYDAPKRANLFTDKKQSRVMSNSFQKRTNVMKMNSKFSTSKYVYGNKVMKFPSKTYGMSRDNKKMSKMLNLNTMKEMVMLSKYKDAMHYQYPVKGVSEEVVREMVDKISMRDINRYQFRRNRSADPGFIVQEAGAGASDDAKNVKK